MTTLIALPRGSSLVASSVPGSVSEHGSVVSSAPASVREDAQRLVVHDRLVRGVDEPHGGSDVDLLPDRALDVLVDDEAVHVAPVRCGALGGDAADERRVGVVEPLVERDVRAIERERRRCKGERCEDERNDREEPQGR